MRTCLDRLGRFAIVAASLGALSVSQAALAGETIALVERATSDTVIDNPPEGDSAGDLLTFANQIYDSENATAVGSNNGLCIRTAVGAAWECFWTLTLKDGSITVEGPFYDGKDSTLAVTGGTGEYSGARGEMALHARNPEGTEYDFVYSLTD